jgi:hypothetical protein
MVNMGPLYIVCNGTSRLSWPDSSKVHVLIAKIDAQEAAAKKH